MIETVAKISESRKRQTTGAENQASKRLYIRLSALAAVLFIVGPVDSAERMEAQAMVESIVAQACFDCHQGESADGDLDLTKLSWPLDDAETLRRWVQIHDRIKAGEMPPDQDDLSTPNRAKLLGALADSIGDAQRQRIRRWGRGALRRLTRTEFEDNLRDLLSLPDLDIADRLPEDRHTHGFRKVSRLLDMSRVQLDGYLDATEAALRRALAGGAKPPKSRKHRFTGTDLFPAWSASGIRPRQQHSAVQSVCQHASTDGHRVRPIRQ